MITQQPLGGKAQFGGSASVRWKCGHSRLTAPLRTSGTLTIKSTTSWAASRSTRQSSRAKTSLSPASRNRFKVLVKEMQSLCLNVEVLSSDGVAIEMKDSDDDVFRAAEELGIDLSRREPSSVDEL